MKNYKESDYALNKYSQGIIYKFADGVVEVTLEDYLRDNPEKTEADFAELKAWSDGIYHEQAVQEQRTCRRNVSLRTLHISTYPAERTRKEGSVQGEQSPAPAYRSSGW